MRLGELKFHKSIYPRGLDKALFLGDINEQKPDEENVESIVEGLKTGGVNHKITYNFKTRHIIDGTHLWLALQRLHGLDWTITDKYLNEIDIPENLEMFYAGMYNFRHGKKLSYGEVKAIIKSYMGDDGTIKYGLQARFAKEYNISVNTIANWVDEMRHGASRQHLIAKAPVEEIDYNTVISRLEAGNQQLKARLEEVTIKWNAICSLHKEVISKCKQCGSR